MALTFQVDDRPAAACHSYRHHLHAEVTRAQRRADPREAGRSRHEDFSVTRRLDHLSPHLLRWCSEGTMLGRVEIRVDAEGEDDKVFRFVLSRVLVTSVLTSFEDDGPLETLTLDYGAIAWEYAAADTLERTSWEVYPAEPPA